MGSMMNMLQDQDWALYDNDCGWCGHRADGGGYQALSFGQAVSIPAREGYHSSRTGNETQLYIPFIWHIRVAT